jgi:uncharacterized membrane protein
MGLMSAPLSLPLLALTSQANDLQISVRWNWDWSPWVTALAAAAVLFTIATVYAREQQFVSRRVRAMLFLLRSISVALVLVMLAQPTIERRRVAPPRMVMLLDVSASMNTRDVPAAELANSSAATSTLTRREAMEQMLEHGTDSLLESLRTRFHVEVVRFANASELITVPEAGAEHAESEQPAPFEPAAAEAETSAAATRLGDAIEFALRQLPGPRPAAIVALTDGINTAGLSIAEAAARARTLGVPLYTVGIGSDRARADVRVSDVLVEEIVFPGDRLQIEAGVRDSGFQGKTARVILREVGTDQILAEVPVTLGGDGEPQAVRLALRPTEPGPMRLELLVDEQPGEEDTANNRIEVTVDVRDQPIRALLVDSTPRFEFRALKSLLERDPAIDLRVWLQDADPDYASVDQAALRAFPATEAELLEYDVILLGDVDPQLLPPQTWDLLESFVSREGGGLAAIGGAHFMPAAYSNVSEVRRLLPIDTSAAYRNTSAIAAAAASQRIAPTPTGLQDPSLQLGETPDASNAIWSELPPIVGSLPKYTAKPGAQVLATPSDATADNVGQQPPVIIRHYVGAGEVLFHATDETWRWRWRNDDRYFARYWGQAVRRLARGRLLRSVGSLSTDRPEYQPDDPVVIRARLRSTAGAVDQDAATVEVTGDSTPTRRIQLTRRGAYSGVYETTLHDLPADRYVAQIIPAGAATPLSTQFVVASPAAELSQLVTNSAGLAEAAGTTGGKHYTVKTATRLAQELPPAKPTAIEQLPDEPLWNSHWFLICLCITLGLEWLTRRRNGLL